MSGFGPVPARQASIAAHGAPFRVSVHENQNVPSLPAAALL